jgi:hypothetical protein
MVQPKSSLWANEDLEEKLKRRIGERNYNKCLKMLKGMATKLMKIQEIIQHRYEGAVRSLDRRNTYLPLTLTILLTENWLERDFESI